MHKRLGIDSYLCDSVEDLKTLNERDMGAEAYVIKEGATYRLMSTGEWVRQSAIGTNTEVDLSGYATEDYVDNKVDGIKIPDTSNFVGREDLQGYVTEMELELVKSNPALKLFDPSLNPAGGASYAIYLAKDNSTTIVDVLREKGIGLYNVWMEKSRTDLPKSMIAANTSGRSFACVDFQSVNDANNFIGYIVLFDKANNMYYQFINHGAANPWMKVAATEE